MTNPAPTTSEDMQKLREVAEKAIPERFGGDRKAVNPGGCDCQLCGEVFIGEPWHTTCEGCEAKAAFEREASPARIISLLNRITELERERDDLEEGWNISRMEWAQLAQAKIDALTAAEQDNARLKERVAALEGGLKPFAEAWSKLHDPIPERPFAIAVDANACARARSLLPQALEPDNG